MNIIDSSGWLEYFADGPNASLFSRPLQKAAELIVPTITIYEVFKAVLRQRDESAALQAVALMQQGSVVDLTAGISIL
jgi:predicted nucleic acid-binding protein